MKNTKLFLSALLLTSCLSLSRRIVSDAPDFTTDTGIPVYMNGVDAGASEADIKAVADRVYYVALSSLCPSDRWEALRRNWTSTYLQFWAKPFPCGGEKRIVGGCLYNGTAYVDGIAVVPDELSHIVFGSCFGRSGEVDYPDGGIEYDADFIAFLNRVKK